VLDAALKQSLIGHQPQNFAQGRDRRVLVDKPDPRPHAASAGVRIVNTLCLEAGDRLRLRLGQLVKGQRFAVRIDIAAHIGGDDFAELFNNLLGSYALFCTARIELGVDGTFDPNIPEQANSRDVCAFFEYPARTAAAEKGGRGLQSRQQRCVGLEYGFRNSASAIGVYGDCEQTQVVA